MPGFNQQGPLGKGPMTGRAQGKCTNYGEKDALKNQNNENINQQTDTEEIDGRGFGRRMGRGFAQVMDKALKEAAAEVAEWEDRIDITETLKTNYHEKNNSYTFSQQQVVCTFWPLRSFCIHRNRRKRNQSDACT